MEGHIQSRGKKKGKVNNENNSAPEKFIYFSEYSFLCQHIIQVTE